MSQSERTFDDAVAMAVDALVDEVGVDAAETRLQNDYATGDDPELHSRQQEALAYLRYEHEGEL